MNNNGTSHSDKDVDESLAVDTREIATAITEYFQEMGTFKTRGFALFVADYNTGKISYISDIEHADAVGMIGMWLEREVRQKIKELS